MKREKVLIVGGGFAGIKAALELTDDNRFEVTLLTEGNHFRYYPSLYKAATGGKRANSAIPLATLFANKRISIVNGTATTLDRKAKTVSTAAGEVIGYDSLVLALGVVTNYFGIPGLAEYSYGIKSLEQVERLKAHLHQQLIDERKPDLNYVIIGGGPTGIELAGTLPPYIKKLMKAHGIRNRNVHVDLVEASPRLLPRAPRDVSRLISRRLRRSGVRLHLGKVVQGQTADSLTVSGKPIQSHTVIWTAGVTNNPFFSNNKFVLMGRGKVATDIYLQAEENIFVLGDNANTPYSGMAQTAVVDGAFLAENLKRRADGKSFKSYTAKEPWSVIPVGERWASATRGGFRTYGILGWLLREAADLVAFHDYQPWQEAGKQWMTEFGHEETCKICTAAIAE
ncbi:NAD(P)/FAD-dependent oxidoreductase [soil metagenome]